MLKLGMPSVQSKSALQPDLRRKRQKEKKEQDYGLCERKERRKRRIK
jgi:hypothetical protein